MPIETMESGRASQAAQIEAAMRTEQGRMFIAKNLMEQIKQERDYVSIGREGFIQDNLEQGEAAYYDTDIKTRATVLPQRGEAPQFRVNSQRVQVPIFPLVSYPMVSIDETKIRRFNILDRLQTKARADIAEEEDRLIFGDLSSIDFSKTTYMGQNKDSRGNLNFIKPDGTTASNTGVSILRYATPESGDSWYNGGHLDDDPFDHLSNAVSYSDIGVTKEFLVGLDAEILQHDLIAEAFIMNPRDFVDLYTWGRDEYDPETQKEVLRTGRMGSIWGKEIHTSKVVPQGTVYCRTSDEYLGVMPILIDLDVLDAPDPRSLLYGFVFFEYIGMAVLNGWGVSRGSVVRTGI